MSDNGYNDWLTERRREDLAPARGCISGFLSALILILVIIAILALTSLSCAAPVAIVAVPAAKSVNINTVINTATSTPVNMVVTAEKLNIRTSPGGEVIHHAYLIQGDIVTVYETQPDANDYQWCRIGLHWVGCGWLGVK